RNATALNLPGAEVTSGQRRTSCSTNNSSSSLILFLLSRNIAASSAVGPGPRLTSSVLITCMLTLLSRREPCTPSESTVFDLHHRTGRPRHYFWAPSACEIEGFEVGDAGIE